MANPTQTRNEKGKFTVDDGRRELASQAASGKIRTITDANLFAAKYNIPRAEVSRIFSTNRKK